MASDTCRTYGMTTVALRVIGPGAGLCVNGVCQFFLITAVGYQLLYVEVLHDVCLLSIPVRRRQADPVCSGEERASHSDLVHQRMVGVTMPCTFLSTSDEGSRLG